MNETNVTGDFFEALTTISGQYFETQKPVPTTAPRPLPGASPVAIPSAASIQPYLPLLLLVGGALLAFRLLK